MWPSLDHHYCLCHMTLNTRNISSAENHDSHFYRPTWTHTNTNTHIHRKVSWKQLLGFKSSLSPPASLTRAGTSEQGSACRVGPERSGRPLKEACGREGFSGRGSALLEVLDIIGKAFSLPRSAAEQSRAAFLYLFLLIPSQRKDSVKETCNRNISRKGGPKQLQSNPWRGRCLKQSNNTMCIK